MTQTSTFQLQDTGLREVIAFPKVDEFYNLLQDRLHMVAGSYILEHHFTLILNALPRRRAMYINRFENVPLIYAGVPRQREMLEGERTDQHVALDRYWNFLDVSDLNSDSAVVSSQLYQSFNLGSYRLADIQQVGMGKLSDYFAPVLHPERGLPALTPRQEAEYHILNTHFNLREDYYLSVPLIQFGEFDGIIHVVFTRKDMPNIGLRSIGNLIRSFSTVLETLILEWDLVGRNPEKAKAIMVPLNPAFYQQINRNPILQELKFDEYYRRHLPFFRARIRFNDDVIHSKIYRPYLKTAIISIMIDSFAHNISAHSLVALNWWFKRRAENLRANAATHRAENAELKSIIDQYLPAGFDHDRLYELVQPLLDTVLVRDDNQEEYDVVKYPGSLAREIQPLLKFLMQKGAFWSGIARDNQFGGESASLYEVLWNDFINNPLYLGTIAKSEDIHRITLRIVHYAPYQEAELRNLLPCHRPKNLLDEGSFITIDLKHRRPATNWDESRGEYLTLADGQQLFLEDHPELGLVSDFVYLGPDFLRIKDILAGYQVFLPGEVVGRHSFFTILENEIRNVKHYRADKLRHIQENGLELCISLQPTHIRHSQNNPYELCRIGVWLNHPNDLVLRDGQLLLGRKFSGLKEGIMDDETFSPRLGGGFQDKICASMLFNNSFSSVQNGDGNSQRDQSDDTDRDSEYYPWITPASSPAHDPHADIELCPSVFEKWDAFTQIYDHEYGYFKKYFPLWLAADIRTVRTALDTDFVWDNLARFKFIHLDTSSAEFRPLFNRIRTQGVIRIIPQLQGANQVGDAAALAAYHRWLPGWLPTESIHLQIRVDDAVVSRFIYAPHHSTHALTFLPAWEPQQEDWNTKAQQCQQQRTIEVAHGGPSHDPRVLRYRNHGVYKKYFLAALEPGQPLSERAQARMAEFFEVIMTHISIVDNRIYNRVRGSLRLPTYEKNLNLIILDEEAPASFDDHNWLGQWEQRKPEMLSKGHFLILHLSFIERLLLLKYADHPDFAEENVGLFIQEEILPWITNSQGEVRDNFMLVITTGRGRTKWWTRLTTHEKYQSYPRFTMFRPVESLISVVEDAIGRQDDIELKYNLVKILFGS